MISKINLAEKFAKLDAHWSPRVVGALDDAYLAKIAKGLLHLASARPRR